MDEKTLAQLSGECVDAEFRALDERAYRKLLKKIEHRADLRWRSITVRTDRYSFVVLVWLYNQGYGILFSGKNVTISW